MPSHGRRSAGTGSCAGSGRGSRRRALQLRAGAYSITEEGDSVVVSGWVRTIDEGRLADTQSRWVYRFNDEDKVVSARVERA